MLLNRTALRSLILTTSLFLSGCGPIAAAIVVATSGGGGGGSGSSSSQTPTQPLQAAVLSQGASSAGGAEVVLRINTPGVTLTPTVNPAAQKGSVAAAATAPPVVTVDGVAVAAEVLDSNTIRIVLPPNPRGNRSVEVPIVIRIGSYLSQGLTYRYSADPISISPINSFLVPAGGGSFTIVGSGFVSDTVVHVGSQVVTLQVNGSEQIVAQAPPAFAGATLDLRVEHPDGSIAFAPGGVHYYQPPPPPPPPLPFVQMDIFPPLPEEVELGQPIVVAGSYFHVVTGPPPSVVVLSTDEISSTRPSGGPVVGKSNDDRYYLPERTSYQLGAFRINAVRLPDHVTLFFQSKVIRILPVRPAQPVLIDVDHESVEVRTLFGLGSNAVEVWRSEEGGPFALLVNNGVNTSYRDTGLNPDTRYTYRVRGLSTFEPSRFSPELEVRTAPTPVSVSVAPVTTALALRLSWANVPGASRYRVLRGGAPGGPFTEILANAASPVDDLGLAPDTTFHYQVEALGTTGSASTSVGSSTTLRVAAQVRRLQPQSAPPGAVLTLYGTGLSDLVEASFGSEPGLNLTLVSDTQAKVRVPSGATPGPLTLRATGRVIGASAGVFTPLDLPLLTGSSVANVVSGSVDLTYSVSQAQSVPVDVVLEYDASGGSFAGPGPFPRLAQGVSSGPGAVGGHALPTSPGGQTYTFRWSTSRDFPRRSLTNLALRARVLLAGVEGAAPPPQTGIEVRNGASFASPVASACGISPRAAQLVDVDRDGKLDLVAADSAGFVLLARGQGDGSFAPTTGLAAGGSDPRGLVVADLNGDSLPDLVVTCAGSNSVSYFENLGGLSFATPLAIPVGTQPAAIAVGDLDGDRKPDLVVANQGSGDLSVVRNLGSGTFAAAVHTAVGVEPVALTLADLDHDRKLDVAIALRGSNAIWVARGQGDGTFAAGKTHSAGAQPVDLVHADVNRDGAIDLACANAGSSDVTLLWGAGDGDFSSQVSLGTGSAPKALRWSDLDGNGALDLIVLCAGSDEVSVRYATGHGVFAGEVRSPAGLTPAAQGLAVGDLDRSGAPDLLTIGAPGQFAWHANLQGPDSEVDFEAALTTAQLYDYTGTQVADFNRDGTLDYVGYHQLGSQLYLGLGRGGGHFEPAQPFAQTGNRPTGLAVGDFNEDGFPDVVTSDSTHPLGVFLNQGNGSFASVVPLATGTGSESVSVADVDEDGHLDIIFSANGFYVMRGDGTGGFSPIERHLTPYYDNRSAVGDFNGDGLLDLVSLFNYEGRLTYMLATGPATFDPPLTSLLSAKPAALRVADLDQDGLDDVLLVLTNPTDELQVWRGTSSGLAYASSYALPTRSYGVAVGDLDGDGARDVVVASEHAVLTFMGLGGVSLAVPSAQLVHKSGSVQLADMDGDGSVDLVIDQVVYRGKGDGTWRVGSSVGDDHISWLPSPVDLQVRDLNFDGRPDLIYAGGGATVVPKKVASVRYAQASGFGPAFEFTVSGAASQVVVARLDADPYYDLVVSQAQGNLFVFPGTGTDTVSGTASGVYSGLSYPKALTAGDLTNDGHEDVLTLDSNSADLYRGSATGALSLASGPPGAVHRIVDIEGDGDNEALSASGSTLQVSRFNGSGFDTQTVVVSGVTVASPLLADFDRDGTKDVVTSSDSGHLLFFKGLPGGTFAAPIQAGSSASIWLFHAEDLDRDGNLDLIGRESTRISVFLGRGDGTFRFATSFHGSGQVIVSAAADLDHDGKTDVAIAGSNRVSVLPRR